MSPKVVLIGPPGAGKSSIGEGLAKKMGVRFSDTDQLIESGEGKRVSQIFIDEGEPFFREIERRVCLQAFSEETGVLALGGGAVLDPVTREALVKLGCEIVFLDVSLKVVAPRIGFNRDRPLLLHNPRQKWQELMDIRRPIYEEIATIVFPVEDKSVGQIVRELSTRFTL